MNVTSAVREKKEEEEEKRDEEQVSDSFHSKRMIADGQRQNGKIWDRSIRNARERAM